MIYASGMVIRSDFANIETGIFTITIGKVFLIAVISIVIYIIDLLSINIVKNDILILDWKYYFKGKVNKIKFFISFVISIMEEIVFRMWILDGTISIFYSLILSSICFGIVHIFFSKYDCVSKAIFGLILGVIYIYTGNIIYTIITHIFYNLFTDMEKNCIKQVNYNS